MMQYPKSCLARSNKALLVSHHVQGALYLHVSCIVQFVALGALKTAVLMHGLIAFPCTPGDFARCLQLLTTRPNNICKQRFVQQVNPY